MWNPVKIEFTNLFAHVNSTYLFKNNTCVVIFGENRTDKNFENNGAGKTTLFEAICLALTGESLRSIRKEEFINYNKNSSEIRFILNNPVLKMELEIVRTFYKSRSSKVEIYENGELNNQIVSVSDANKRVYELIGIGREDLLRYFIISQDNHYTFFTACDVEKKEVINRITNANMIIPVLEEIDVRLKICDEKLDEHKEKKMALESRIETLQEQLSELEEDDNSDEIEELQHTIKETKERIKEYSEYISGTKLKDTTKLREKRKKLKSEIEELSDKIGDNQLLKRNIQTEIDVEVICPECGKKIIPNSKLNLTPKTAKKALEKVELELGKQNETYELKRKESKSLLSEIEENDELNILLNDKKLKKENLERKLKGYEKELSELKNNDNNSQKKKITAKIMESEKELEVVNNNMKTINNEIEMLKFWKFSMGKNGFITYLANKSVKVIEGVTNSFLKKFVVDISVVINGFKINHKGELKEKIEVFIDDGVKECSFMARSGGERGRVTLAGVLGIHHLINMSTNGRGLNLLLLDEAFEGVDTLGVESIIKIFEKIGITILVISQNITDEFHNENSLYVVKENGVATYLNQ